MSKKITIKDIAKEAGVSFQVVSAILSGKGDTIRFSEKTKEKIEAVARKSNYSPSILARGFQANRSFLIGILGSCNSSFMYSGLVRGTQEALFESGFSPMFLSHRTNEEEMRNLDHFLGRQVEGILLDPLTMTDEKEKRYLDLVNKKLPILNLFGSGLKKVPTVSQDMYQVGYQATKHLQERGRKRIALLTHFKYKHVHDSFSQFQGYEKALQETNSEPILFTHSLEHWNPENLLSWNNGAMEVTNDILQSKYIDGVVCYDVAQCHALIQKAKELNIRIPEEKALIGYHDWDICDITSPSITSINVSPFDMGVAAAEMMLEMLEGKTVTDRLVSPRLKIRESSGVCL